MAVGSGRPGLRAHLARLEALQPLPFNGWDDWDASGRLKPDARSYGPFMRHRERPPSVPQPES